MEMESAGVEKSVEKCVKICVSTKGCGLHVKVHVGERTLVKN